MNGPLEGIKVVECGIWQMGPSATASLGDLGAEVIKVEERIHGDPGRGIKWIRGIPVELPQGKSWYFEYNNRNKRSITLDLKKAEGREIFFKLIKITDVFIQNFRLGVADELGIDYSKLSKCNPKLIYASATGFGSKGPDAKEPAFDYLGQARSGMMMIGGEPDAPPVVYGAGIADQIGAIMLASGVLAALVARERTGIGQEIEVSHLGSGINLLGLDVFGTIVSGHTPPRVSRTKAYNPLWNIYMCGDKKWIALAMLQPDRYWSTLCRAIGQEKLIDDPRFNNMESRRENCEELIAILDQVFITKSSTEWLKILKKAGDIICSPVNTLEDLITDPQAIENEYITEFDHPALGKIKTVGMPVKFSKSPGKMRLQAPEFGEHSEEILLELGYSWDDIAKFKDGEVI
ncbi:MAG: CoA transferase [Desulfobacteraceae bacterium]|nr:CoA transferase [Desulfobacteraceae bacterium]